MKGDRTPAEIKADLLVGYRVLAELAVVLGFLVWAGCIRWVGGNQMDSWGLIIIALLLLISIKIDQLGRHD